MECIKSSTCSLKFTYIIISSSSHNNHLLPSDFQISFKYLKEVHTASKLQSQNSNLRQNLACRLFVLLGDKSVCDLKSVSKLFPQFTESIYSAAGIL